MAPKLNAEFRNHTLVPPAGISSIIKAFLQIVLVGHVNPCSYQRGPSCLMLFGRRVNP